MTLTHINARQCEGHGHKTVDAAAARKTRVFLWRAVAAMAGAALFGLIASPLLPFAWLTVPRQVVDAAITVIDMRDGSLVDKYRTGASDIELRHLASGRLDRIFAIQARLGNDEAVRSVERGVDEVYHFDITTEPGSNYLPAATLRYDARKKRATRMGGRNETAMMRHGLSIIYDEANDQAIATYPTAHRVMAFDGASGAVTAVIDTSRIGLRYPCGIALLPDGIHYAVTGYWENLFVFERRTHRLVRDLCQYPMFFGHSHISVG